MRIFPQPARWPAGEVAKAVATAAEAAVAKVGDDAGAADAAGVVYRKARMSDVRAMQQLINRYAEKGLMLPRPLVMLYETLRDFTVAEVDGELVAAGALHIVWEDLAEVRALAVAPGWERRGIGRGLVRVLLEEARRLAVSRVFALTYQPAFFEKCGFCMVPKETLPQKVWGECINCPKFPQCDEVAVLIEIGPKEG